MVCPMMFEYLQLPHFTISRISFFFYYRRQEFLATAYAAYAAGVPLSSQSTFVEPQAPVLPHQESASRIKPSVAEMNEIGSLEPLAGEQHGLLGDQPTLQPYACLFFSLCVCPSVIIFFFVFMLLQIAC